MVRAVEEKITLGKKESEDDADWDGYGSGEDDGV
jgi:hypothetical protein